MRALRPLLITIIASLWSLPSLATHIAGGEIYWDCIGTNSYRFSLVIYRDCAGQQLNNSYTLNLNSPCGNRAVNVTLQSSSEISQLCNSQLVNSTCSGGSLPGMQEYIYTGVVNNLTPCDSWRISWDERYRNAAIVNLVSPGSTNMFIEAVMNSQAQPCNDSPHFSNIAIPFVCAGQPVSFSYGAYDLEGDSLSYTLVQARGQFGDPVGYISGYSPSVPIPGLTLDPTTGLVNFTLANPGHYVVVVRVDIWVNGVRVGSIMRDMQFVARNCANLPPDPTTGTVSELTGNAVQTGPYALNVCESGDFCARMVVTDPNPTNILTATSNVALNLPGATMTTSGTNPLTIDVCWTAADGNQGFFPFIITVNDGACPIPAFQTYVYAVQVIPGLHLTTNTTTESCAGANNGTASVQVTEGLAPFTYLWNTGAATSSIQGAPGSYDVLVTDANGCVNHPANIAIGAGPAAPVAFAGADVFACMADVPVVLTGTVTNATGGTWSGGNGTYTGSGANVIYHPTQAEVNAGGLELYFTTTGNGTCPADRDSVLLILPNSFRNSAINSSPVSCFGASDGQAVYTPNSPMLTFQWSPSGQMTSTATGLAAGQHTILVRDFFGCDTTIQVTVGGPSQLQIDQLDLQHEQCAGSGDGTVTPTVTGGVAPYTYAWSNGSDAASITVGAGSYDLTVTDHTGCSITAPTVTVNALGQPNSADAGSYPAICHDQLPIQLLGSVVNATGGQWSGGSGTFTGNGLTPTYQPSAAEISAGQVTLTLTTTGNTTCPPASDDVTILLSNSFLQATVGATDVLCHGGNTGSASFTPAAPSLSYLWNDPTGQTTSTATHLTAGDYNLTVTDAHGCQFTADIQVDQPDALAFNSINATAEQCAGDQSGSVTAVPEGGTAPYRFLWTNGDTTATIQVGAGAYVVTVTDAQGCQSTSVPGYVAALGQPNQADAGADLLVCSDELPVVLAGSVVNATGGQWSGGQGQFSGTWPDMVYMPTSAEVLAGSVDLVLTTVGNNTCPPDQDTVRVRLPHSFFGSAVTATHLQCHSDASGSASFSPAEPSFTYQWNDPAAQTTPIAHYLQAGTYELTVTDTDGCDSTLVVTLSQPPALVLSDMVTTDPTCPGSTNGIATAVATGGLFPYSFAWSDNANGQVTQTITGIGSGSYTVTVTDANNCQAQSTGTLISNPPITLTALMPDTVCVNAPVQMTALATGGNGIHTINWSGIGTGDTLTHSFAATQNVTVQVTDGAGCAGPVLVLPVHVLDLALADIVLHGDTTICPGGTAQVGASVVNYPGMVDLTWPTLQTTGHGPFPVQPLTGSGYPVVVTDACGSQLTATVPVNIQFPPVIELPPIIAEGCAPITVQMPSGLTTQQVSYLWDFGDNTASVAVAPTHTYATGVFTVNLTVTTPIGCSAQAATTGQVIGHGAPVASFNASTWQTDFDHATIHFTNTSTGPAQIQESHWTFGDGGTSDDHSPSHHYTTIGTSWVQLQVVDEFGCTASVTHPVTIDPVYDITIPNAFTPNPHSGNGGAYDPNDLSNDVFYPFIRFVKEFNMRVYNRWGELVFETQDIRRGWDGYYRGMLSQQDVYVYRMWVRFVDDKEVQQMGDITLFR